LVAHERNIPKEEVKAALGLRYKPLMAFVKKHRLSFDWLLAGDLKVCVRCGGAPDTTRSGQEARRFTPGGHSSFFNQYVGTLLANRGTPPRRARINAQGNPPLNLAGFFFLVYLKEGAN
jgi:hypothetical protein